MLILNIPSGICWRAALVIGSRPYLTRSKRAQVLHFVAVCWRGVPVIVRNTRQISQRQHGQRTARGIRAPGLEISPGGPESQAAQPSLPIAGKPGSLQLFPRAAVCHSRLLISCDPLQVRPSTVAAASSRPSWCPGWPIPKHLDGK